MTRGESVWPAPAKLNLFLHVVGRRPDGYHDLQTIFQLVDLCDRITIRLREDSRIERPEGANGVEPEADLAARAARALQAATGARQGATLRVHKRIPLGGGLGGGSSDAATVLLAL
ncbi:MAG: 4-(cytidine 5'-diphospho)-2-C-methyl-D-erythritol kinase, partial [Steroidobacteraceae bacterium]